MRYFIIIIIPVILSSCYSNLRITVDTFDRKALINSSEYLENEIKIIEDRLNIKSTRQYQDEIYNGIYGLVNQEVRPIFVNHRDNTFANSAMEYYSKLIRNNISIADTCFRSILDEIYKLNEIDNHALSTFKSKEIGAEKLITNFMDQTETDALKLGLDIDFERIKNKLKIELNTKVAEINSTFGVLITGDTYASLITKAPNRYWRKYKKKVNIENPVNPKRRLAKSRINKTGACTFFGNADLAFIMDQPGSFTVKGVRLDASEAIKSSFTVFRQGLKYLALSSGVIISDPSIKETSDFQEARIPELTENQNLEYKLEYADDAFNRATKSFLSIIFIQRKILDDPNVDDERKKEALNIIKDTYIVYKDQIQTLNE